jgi:hypothetical protein
MRHMLVMSRAAAVKPRILVRTIALCAAVLGLACAGESRQSQQPVYYPAQGNYPPGQYPPGQYPPGQQAQVPQQQYPQQAYPQQQQHPQQQFPQQQAPQQQPQQLPQVSGLPVLVDPINNVDIAFLRGRAQTILNELVAALPAGQQQRVAGIPLVVDDRVGEVNAFAACTKSGRPAMAITDGLLDIEAHLAQARATDEVFGTRKVDGYIQLLAQNQRPNQPVVRPPAGFFDLRQQTDARKVARQHQILDEQIAFVMGHELGHHYLGHLPCTAGSSGVSELGRVLSDAVPLFNQPNEIAADVAGTNNVLTLGSRRTDYRLTEGGGLLTMQFFAGLDQLTPSTIVFGFERSHPPPQLRSPIIQQTANTWRATGGRLQFPF